jgi:cytoskeletal protein RodZ
LVSFPENIWKYSNERVKLTLLITVSGQEKSVGSILRETREAQGLSLEDVAKITRIGKGYLVALEEEMFDKLPSVAYVRGFLRVYATCLSLSEKDIIALYEKTIAENHIQTDNQLPDPEPENGGKANAGIGKKHWYVLALLTLVAVSVFSIMQEAPGRKIRPQGQNVPAPAPVNTKIMASTAPYPRSASPQADVKKHEVPESTEEMKTREIMNYGSQSPKGILLKIRVIEDGWLDITIDDAVTQHYELKSGDLIEWKGEKVFTLDISNPGGIDAELNGKALKPFGKVGESAHVSLKAEDK